MAAAAYAAPAEPVPLHGSALALAGFLLAMGNFMVVLDMTIANVSVPNIAGGLAVAPSEGTWVITSYSVAEAIMVPLTGWLAQRFGAVRVFVTGIIGFGICSALCGLAPSLGLLVTFRVMQGLCGGPIMPMSQTLMMRVFPPNQRGQAMGLWSMTTVVAPIAGPILGGTLCDTAGWPWVFYINVPVAAICGFFAWRMLASQETPTMARRVDFPGLALLVLFVGTLQIMLDKGQELDWFGSPFIVALAIVAAIAFAAFLIWELTDEHPIVDLRVFRHRGFTGAVITIALTFGTFFSSIVLGPLWLQTNMGYTATWAGYTTAFGGVLAVVFSPIVPRLMTRIDPRALVSFGVLGLAVTSLVRSQFASNADFWTVGFTFLIQGAFMPFFFVPTTQIALSSVLPQEMASAAGLSNFLRTTSAAFSASLVTTMWANASTRNHANIAGALNDPAATQRILAHGGMSAAQSLSQVDNLAQSQAVMLATDQLYLVMAAAFVIAAIGVWLGPKPKIFSSAGGGGH
ncbi:MAG TPA: DHA2 family efflux MFS transporter permease subunit [Caulobacteraceae bacterium]|jgi:DHA2 family multidrug resistance protein|nr:DHA2 family efflux MFS transporter permease subunit [Caulobacteraceae bacterium]